MTQKFDFFLMAITGCLEKIPSLIQVLVKLLLRIEIKGVFLLMELKKKWFSQTL